MKSLVPKNRIPGVIAYHDHRFHLHSERRGLYLGKGHPGHSQVSTCRNPWGTRPRKAGRPKAESLRTSIYRCGHVLRRKGAKPRSAVARPQAQCSVSTSLLPGPFTASPSHHGGEGFSTFKGLWDSIGPNWVIQDPLPSSRAADQQPSLHPQP